MAEYISREEVLEHSEYTGNFNLVVPVRFIKVMKTADVQPVPQWISVDDRLPESEKEVLVWYKYTWDAGFTSYGFGINVWYSNTKQWRDGCLLKSVEVLYWQLLPEPPKDGDTNE